MKAELETRNLQAKGEATKVAEKIDGRNVVVLRQASETGQLFGSVTVRDIIASFEADGVSISRGQVMLDAPIKTIGKHNIAIAVHPEVEVAVSVTVARSADEAERINRGEDIPRVRKIRTPPPKRSPPPANSSIPKRAATTSRRKMLVPRSKRGLPCITLKASPASGRAGIWPSLLPAASQLTPARWRYAFLFRR